MTEHKHSLLSPSSAHRWMKCTASVDLCKDIPRVDNPASEKGTFLHEVAHDYLVNKLPYVMMPHVLLDNAPGEIREYLRYVFKLQESGTNYYEQRLEIDKSDQSEYKIFGTADCVHISNGNLEIIDLKTGSIPVEAKENLQLLIYAFMAFKTFCANTPYHGLIVKMTIIQHEVIDTWELPIEHLTAMTRDIFRAQTEIYLGDTEYVLGDHCQYCPGKNMCPKYIQDLKVLDYSFKGIQHLSLDEMQRILLVRKKLDCYLDTIEKELENKLKEGVILENFELRPKRGRRVLSKSEEELRSELRKKDNYEDYLDLKSLTAIEKFDKVFVYENTTYIAGQLGLAIKKVTEDEFKFTALPSTGN